MLFLSGSAWASPQKLKSRPFKICGRAVKLEVASTPDERSIGLMDRAGIPAGHGMIFVFEDSQKLFFWMKNVPFDIDIGFFDSKGRLKSFTTMLGTSPLMKDEVLPRYEGPDLALYAIEMPKGFFKKTDSKSCTLSPLP